MTPVEEVEIDAVKYTSQNIEGQFFVMFFYGSLGST